jgi:hypothetical protein
MDGKVRFTAARAWAIVFVGGLRDMLAAFSFCGSVQMQIPRGLPHKKSQQSRR